MAYLHFTKNKHLGLLATEDSKLRINFCYCFLSLFGAQAFALASVVVVDVAILALSFRVVPSVFMLTVGNHALSAVSVVTVVAHALSKVL